MMFSINGKRKKFLQFQDHDDFFVGLKDLMEVEKTTMMELLHDLNLSMDQVTLFAKATHELGCPGLLGLLLDGSVDNTIWSSVERWISKDIMKI